MTHDTVTGWILFERSIFSNHQFSVVRFPAKTALQVAVKMEATPCQAKVMQYIEMFLLDKHFFFATFGFFFGII